MKKVTVVSLVVGLFIFVLATMVRAEDFSADMISTTRGKILKGKIFISKDKTRMESQDGITITRMDKKVVWIMMPNDKRYMEQAFDPGKAMATSERVTGEIERTFIGDEMIDGKMTKKYRVVYNQNGRKETMLQWIAADLRMPVKMASVDNSWTMEYKNIRTGRQPDSIFEVPGDYQKFSYQRPTMKDMLKGLVR